MSKFRLPRKTKKVLKKLILEGKDPNWKTKECKILKVTKNYKNYSKVPTYKSLSVTAYSLG